MAKYGMSMCVLGMAEEFKDDHIAVNALWPRTLIHTAASELLVADDSFPFSRSTDIMADAAYYMLIQESSTWTGQFMVDEDVVRLAGIIDLVPYANVKENAHKLTLDGYVD